MSFVIRLTKEAKVDLTEASSWYEVQQTGLGDELVSAVDQTLDRIKFSPLVFPMVYGDIRRALAPRFPYDIFYLIEHSEIIVLAIIHESRHDSNWQNR
jgi:plasmid stabilization system protein ParE